MEDLKITDRIPKNNGDRKITDCKIADEMLTRIPGSEK